AAQAVADEMQRATAEALAHAPREGIGADFERAAPVIAEAVRGEALAGKARGERQEERARHPESRNQYDIAAHTVFPLIFPLIFRTAQISRSPARCACRARPDSSWRTRGASPGAGCRPRTRSSRRSSPSRRSRWKDAR